MATATATRPQPYIPRQRDPSTGTSQAAPARAGVVSPAVAGWNSPLARFGMVAAAVTGGILYFKFKKTPETPEAAAAAAAADPAKAAELKEAEEKKKMLEHRHAPKAARSGTFLEKWQSAHWASRLSGLALTGLATLGLLQMIRETRG